MYSEEKASTILTNCDHMVYMGGQDLKTARYIGTRVGKTEDKVLLMPLDKVYVLERGSKGSLKDKIEPDIELYRKIEREKLEIERMEKIELMDEDVVPF